MKLGQKIRELRENKGLLLREIAAILEIDTAMISKIERNEKSLKREHLPKLSKIFEVSEDELTIIWISDKVLDLVENEDLAIKALELTKNRIKSIKNEQ